MTHADVDAVEAFEQRLAEARRGAVRDDDIRARVLDAVAKGRIPQDGPSEIAAHGLLDDVPDGYWERWSRDAAERIRKQVEDSFTEDER